MTRGDLIRIIERSDAFSMFSAENPDEIAEIAQRWAKYDVRAVAAGAFGYLVEVVLDDGLVTWSEQFEDADGVVDAFLELRSKTMVDRVRILATHTGEVLCDLPGRNRVAAQTGVSTIRALVVDVRR